MAKFTANGQPEGALPPCKPAPFQFDAAAYAQPGSMLRTGGDPGVGTVRGHPLGLLEVRPVAYDAVTGRSRSGREWM